MSKRTHLIALVTLTGALTLGGAAAAEATTVNVGGGTWDYGGSFLTTWTYSNYIHPTKNHGSTACNANSCDESGPTPRNVWSKARVHSTLSGGNKTYWHTN